MLCHAVLEPLSQRLAQTPPAEHITLVGHSLGGLLVVRMLGDEQLVARHANVLNLVDGSVLFTPIDVAVKKEPAAFRAIVDLTDMQVAIAVVKGLLRQKVAEGIVAGVSDRAERNARGGRSGLPHPRDRQHAPRAPVDDP